jgi:hypothetical protein
MMYMTYKFTHFHEKEQSGKRVVLENDLQQLQAYPAYMELNLDE